MSRRNIAEEWKLEEGDTPDEQWKLQPAEQNALSQWQLQEEQGPPNPLNDWQPVEYARERRTARGNWILPALVGVALVAVLAYGAWVVLGRLGVLDPVTSPAAPNEQAPVAEPTVEQTTTAPEAPTATLPPPTPTPEPPPTPTPEPSPTPPPVVNQESVIVPTVGGVNARRTPDIGGEVIQILPQGDAKYLVIADQGDWIQIALPDGQQAWVAAEVVQRVTDTLLLDQANQNRAAVGLPPLAAPAPVEGAPVITGTAPTTGTTGTTTGLTAPATISVTINVTTGLNARETPALTGTVVELLTNSSSYRAVARTADNQWLQIVLPDGRLAWVSTPFVTPEGDVNTLSTEPLTDSAILLAASTPLTATTSLTATTPLTATQALTTGSPLTGTGAVAPSTSPTVTQVADGVTATVSSLSGANARGVPDREADSLQVLAFGAAVPVVGRSADNEWVQVTLSEGQLAWVLAEAVTLNAAIDTLPVVNP
jgi:uncharacterized protein YgiM (DUF1202 family)